MRIHLLKPALFIACLVLPAWLAYWRQVISRQKAGGKIADTKTGWLVLAFMVYVSIVLELTIAPTSISGFGNSRQPGFNIVPVVNTYKQFISTIGRPSKVSFELALANIIGNLLLFLPMGLFLPALFPAFNTVGKVAITCFCFSLFIEFVQLIIRRFGIYRMADIDDIILNTTGGILGWLIFHHLLAGIYLSKNARPKVIIE